MGVSGAFATNPVQTRQIARFNPRFWTTNGPLSTRFSVVSSGSNVTCNAELQKFSDLVGLIWESKDSSSHPLRSRRTNYDYSGIKLEFSYETSSNFTAFEDPFSEPTMTVNYLDGTVQYVSLLVYAPSGWTDHNALIRINFDKLKAGSYYSQTIPQYEGQPGFLNPISPVGIKSLEFSVFPQYYSPTNNNPINNGSVSPGAAIWLTLANITVTSNLGVSANAFDVVGSFQSQGFPKHGMSNDYDSINCTPELLVDNWLGLGFTSVDHYTGVRPYSLKYDSGSGRYIIDSSKTINTAYSAFHQDLANRLTAASIPFKFAMSFELFTADIPANWDQQDWNNNSAETGYANPTTYARFQDSTVGTFLKNMAAALVALVPSGANFTFQMGEYALWAGTNNGPSHATIGPCIFDFALKVAYNTATGNFAPEIDAPIVSYASLSSPQKAYVDWVRGALGTFCDAMSAVVKAARSGTLVSALFYADAILDSDSASNGFMQQLNIPYEHWKFSNGTLDKIEGEQYGFTTPSYSKTDLQALFTVLTGATSTVPNLGFAASKTTFYTGLATDPSATMNVAAYFGPMIEAANDAIAMGFAEVQWWSWTQFQQLGFYLTGGQQLTVPQLTEGTPTSYGSAPAITGQVRHFTFQVYRNGTWVTIPVKSASAQINRGQAGVLTCVADDNPSDKYRSQLYEGEKIRAFRGVVGQNNVRSWTGFVDAPTATDNGPISRSFSCTDHVQELNTSMLLWGMVFDNQDPMAACASVIQHALDTQQLKLTDDSGNVLSSTANYSTSSGNKICYFPTLYNPDGSPFVLASGQLGSFTSGNFAYASLSVPMASSGQGYITYTLPQQYLIASMTQLLSFPTATGTTIPPPSGSVAIDYFNGILYFNPVDANKELFASSTFFASPLWAYAPGTKVMDIISEIMDKSGCRWGVDAMGKFYAQYIDTVVAPSRLFTRAEYGELSIQTNRDRRNVIVCQGWDDVYSQLIVAMAVNQTDINNAPPTGLGKRQYMIVQDQSWRSQDTVNAAAYFAMQQIGKRGKIASVDMIDDPSITSRSVIGFIGALPETGPGDFFWVDSMSWNYSSKSGQVQSKMNLNGHLIPGQGLAFINPVSNINSSTGSMDFTNNPTPLASCSLSPPGGKYSSTFSLASGVTLIFSEPGNYVVPDGHGGFIALHARLVQVNVYGSDGSSFGPFILGSPYDGGGGPKNYAIPTTGMVAGVMYVVKLTFEDPYGNVGYYRDFITALP